MTDTVNPDGDYDISADVGFFATAGTTPPPPVLGNLTMQPSVDFDAGGHADGDAVRVQGTVRERIDATTQRPVSRLVRLHCQATGRMVAQTWSAADGSYAFERVPAGRYMVLSVDHTGQFAGVLEPDLLVQIKQSPTAHHTQRWEPYVKLAPYIIYVRDRNPVNEFGGGF